MMPDCHSKNVMEYKTKGTILRSTVRWHEYWEENTRYFYSLEKRNYENKKTTRLKLSYCFISRQDIVFCQRYIVSALRYIVSA